MRAFRKSRRAKSKDDFETWIEDDVTNTLNVFDLGGDTRATTVVVYEVDNDNDEYIPDGERGRNNTIVIGK